MKLRSVLILAGFLGIQPALLSRGAHAENTPIRFEIALPEGQSSADLIWGLQRGGLELARGEQRLEAPGGTAASATSRFEARADDISTEARGSITVYLNLNQDQWRSYVPSFGDVFQIVTPRWSGQAWVVSATRDNWRTQTACEPGAVLTVHYHRFDGQYRNVSLWTWDEPLKRAPKSNELLPVGRDDFGVVFQLDTALYGKKGDRIGLLPRLNASWDFKDPPDRFWAAAMGQTVYLVQESEQVSAAVPDVSPKLIAARLDGPAEITAVLNHPVPAADISAESFEVSTEEGKNVGIKTATPLDASGKQAGEFRLAMEEPLKFPEVSYTVQGKKLGRVPLQAGLILQSPLFSALDVQLGAVYAPERTIFRVFAPTARRVKVVVAKSLEGDEGLAEQDMTRTRHGVWEAEVPGDLAGRYYAYELTGPGLNPGREVGDIYATCAQAGHARCLIVDLKKTDPFGFRDNPFRRPRSAVDAIIYEMHVRDFTIAAISGCSRRGKYLGLAETGTSLPGHPEIRTGLDHLRELGITHVQLMPIQDFDNRNEENENEYNWGYMPVHLNSPEGWFASTPMGPARITELKTAIQALHKAGIGVIMDVVYNHTSPQAGFDQLVPGYYYRTDRRGRFSNGSGCGNEFRSESPMGRKFIIDSLSFWVREYQVDGFRFDLMGLMDVEIMKAIRDELWKLDPGIVIYGEPWTGGRTPLREQADKGGVRGTGIGAFNDDFRDAIKGDREGGVPGFIQAGERVDRMKRGLAGLTDGWPASPIDTLNYFECHDDLNAWDKLVISTPGASDVMRQRMMRLGALALVTSQGRVFIQAGQEFCRTKRGIRNTYNQPDEVNQIDWSRKLAYRPVFEYFQGLIAFRKAHPALRLSSAAQVRKRVSFPDTPTPKCVIYRVDGEDITGETADTILVLMNGENRDVRFALPAGDWATHADADRASVEPLRQTRGEVVLPAHSGVLLAGN